MLGYSYKRHKAIQGLAKQSEDVKIRFGSDSMSNDSDSLRVTRIKKRKTTVIRSLRGLDSIRQNCSEFLSKSMGENEG
jgi:hypothetical protein